MSYAYFYVITKKFWYYTEWGKEIGCIFKNLYAIII